MHRVRNYTDEELTSYLDGEASDTMAHELDTALETDAALQARLQSLDIDKTKIKSAFDDLLKQAPAAPAVQTVPRRSYASVAAAALVGLLVGSSAMMLWPSHDTRTWQDFAATYHALYVKETLEDIRESIEDSETKLRGNAARLGQQIAPGRISRFAGLTLKRSQVLGFKGRPILQIAYLSDTGTPVALCIMQRENAPDTALSTGAMQNMASASWIKGGFEYLLIGGTDEVAIQTAAQEAMTLL